ncbi:hypothetical protein ACHAXR_010020 [Thalassiosira sp. AJA248-18]
MGQPTRAYAPHTPSWQRFHEFAAPLASSSGAGSAAAGASSSINHPYARQYSHVYSARLAALRERCVANAQQSLKNDGIVVGKGGGEGEEEGAAHVAEKIIEVKEGVWSILVGTIVKEVDDAKRRPVVETKYGDAADAQSFLFPGTQQKQHQESLRSYLFDSEKGDVLHLEDESGRVELAPEDDAMDVDSDSTKRSNNALDPNKVATGVVAAVVGKICATKGIMHVHSIHFAGPPPEDASSASGVEQLRGPTTLNDDDEEPTLLLVSGLGCGSDSPHDATTGASLALRREMLLEYLTDPAMSNGASVCRVIVAGGGVIPTTTSSNDDDEDNNNKENSKKKSYNSIAMTQKSKNDSITNTACALRELDLYLTELLSCGIPIDYVPGMHDPTNANWPQRPMHSCLLPLSCAYVDLFGRGTNPYEGILGGGREKKSGGVSEKKSGGVRVLGSDGLNIADLRRFLAVKSPKEDDGAEEDGKEATASSCIDALNQTLKYGHMTPTGPDSLPTFPSSESDPFVLKYRPSVYFVGNCDKFETRLADADGQEIEEDASVNKHDGQNATRLVCIPSFALTGEVVLVKLRSLKCEVISFNDACL